MADKTYYLTYVVGERGVGKTTLLAHFATECMIPPRSVYDLQLCRKEIGRLRAGGWDNLSLAPHVKHLVYCRGRYLYRAGHMGYKPRISMELAFEKIGLYDGKHEVSYLLPYAKVFMPEIQSKLDSRKWEQTAEYFLRYIERQRKVGVQMWADTQIDDSADKRFRNLADKLIEVQRKTDYCAKNGQIIKTVWECLEFSGVRPYARYKETGGLREATATAYAHTGNIYACVDSFSGKEYFYSGMAGNYHTPLAKPIGNDKKAMLERCEKYPLFIKGDTDPKEHDIWKN
jgi:hypothetical protein